MVQSSDPLTIEQAAKDYIDRRGIMLEFRCSRCVHAARLPVEGIDAGQRLSMKVRYIGPAGEQPPTLRMRRDPWCYRWIGSPFPEQPRTYLTYGYHRDTSGGLWAEYYNHVCLKDPRLREQGVRIEAEIPETVAEKQPVWQVFCNGEEVHRETLDRPGRITRDIGIEHVSRELIEYMTEVRRQQRHVIGEFSRICDKYHLRWYLICGGLIGLVRDGSLIPWDDDLDIAMPMADYKRFLSAARKEWKEKQLVLVRPDQYGCNVFLDQMTRLVNQEETIDGDPFERINDGGRADLHHHLAVDLYILQDACGSHIRHWVQTRTLQALYAMALGHREQVDLGKERMEKGRTLLAARMLRAVGRHIPLKRIQDRYDSVVNRSTGKGSQYVFQANGYHACIPMRFDRDWFGKGKEYTADGMTFRIPERPEAFLKTMYGDYRTLPNFFSRCPAHWGREEQRHYHG